MTSSRVGRSAASPWKAEQRAQGETTSSPASPLQLRVLTSPTFPIAAGGTFSPTTATLVTGPTEAVLVDTLYRPAEVDRLADAVAASGKTLTTIYITHAHFDHYFGLGALLARFPRCARGGPAAGGRLPA